MIVAWDFDGVLNDGAPGGRFLWPRDFDRDFGIPFDGFARHVFTGFDPIMTGREDLRDRIASWCRAARCPADADAVLAWWFERDAHPDPVTGALVDALAARGVRQVIATNNEDRRTRHIEGALGWAGRVERVFASGRLGLRKPDPAFFAAVTDALGVAPDEMMLVDDLRPNVRAARAAGWRAFHYAGDAKAMLPEALGLSGHSPAPAPISAP